MAPNYSMLNICFTQLHMDKMATISQRIFESAFFLNDNIWIPNLTEVCPEESNWQYSSIGLDNGLALNKWQAIIWTNPNQIYWHIFVYIYM